MAFLDAQVSFPFFTNIPQDVITNTFHFESSGVTNTAAALEITEKLATFYADAFVKPGSAANYVLWYQGTCKVYDLSEPPPRVPIINAISPTVNAPGGTTLPTEVALVVSYHAAPESGIPAARRRGRIYLGGLGYTAISDGSETAFPIFDNTFLGNVKTAANNLRLNTSGGVEWVQRSTVGLITSNTISGGWVDNSPDTQRRRGIPATLRGVWPSV